MDKKTVDRTLPLPRTYPMRKTRRVLVAIVLALVSLALFAGSALADKPFTFTGSVTFPDDNPCTPVFDPLEHLVTIDFVVTVHEHENNIVAFAERSGTTSSGFTMINGRDSFVDNGNVLRGNLMDQWQHPDGSKLQARGTFLVNLNTAEVQVEKGALRCLGNK